MKKAVVEAWLSGLRSGEYKQHRGALTDKFNDYLPRGDEDNKPIEEGTSFCCIGVAGMIAGFVGLMNTNECANFLNLDDSYTNELVKMNDDDHKSFLEIADWIEANILPNATE